MVMDTVDNRNYAFRINARKSPSWQHCWHRARVLALRFFLSACLVGQLSKERVACCLISVVSAIHRFSLAAVGPFFRWFSCNSTTEKI